MTMPFQEIAAACAADGVISAEELRQLRAASWCDGTISAEEAEAIFAINDRLAATGGETAEWVDYFVEALTTWLVDQQVPRGYVDAAKADFLIARIEADGQMDTMAELELVIRSFEKAIDTPPALKAYAYAHIERAVLTGTGPTRDGGALAPGRITAEEVKVLRRLVFASGSEGPACVSQGEAEMLFRIKDATLGADNAREWEQLFVQAVGNYLRGLQYFAPVAREREAELEHFMALPESGLENFLGRMLRCKPQPIARDLASEHLGHDPSRRHSLADRLRARPDDELLGHDLAAQGRADDALTPAESAWLKAEMDADHQLDTLERALLAFLRDG